MSRFLTLLLLAHAGGVRAQPVVLCDVPWMDAERVRALVAVEAPDAEAEFAVADCRVDRATVTVSYPEGVARSRTVSLADTAATARARLVALVLVELARLGPPAPPAPIVDDGTSTAPVLPEAATGDGTGGGEAAPEPRALETGEALPSPTDAAAAPMEAPATATVVPRAEGPLARPPVDASAEEPWPDSWTVGLGYGGAFHQIDSWGTLAIGRISHQQLRVLARWRFLRAGLRLAGRAGRREPTTDAAIGSVTGLLGAEVLAGDRHRWRWAAGGTLEGGVLGARGNPCGEEFPCPFGDWVATGGAQLWFRVEHRIARAFVALELELGWSRGLGVRSDAPIAAMGGPMAGLLLELAVGEKTP